jgi:hypothetical protein
MTFGAIIYKKKLQASDAWIRVLRTLIITAKFWKHWKATEVNISL